MHSDTKDALQTIEPQELAADELAHVQGGAAAGTVATQAGDDTSAAAGKRKPHPGGVQVILADGSVR